MEELTQKWNNFVKSLVATKNAWDTLAELMKTRPNTESLPRTVQKVMSFATVRRGSNFNTAIPRLLEYFRKYSGFDDLEIPVLKPEIKKEKDNAGTKQSGRPNGQRNKSGRFVKEHSD